MKSDSITLQGRSHDGGESVDEIFHQKNIRGSSNGRTTVFGAVYLGSNPGPRAMIYKYSVIVSCFLRFLLNAFYKIFRGHMVVLLKCFDAILIIF